MKALIFKLFSSVLLIFTALACFSQNKDQKFSFDFCGHTFNFDLDGSAVTGFSKNLSEQSVQSFYRVIESGNYKPLISKLLDYKKEHNLSDWLYYQLIRRTAQHISPKSENYERYTLYKWFLLAKSGYDARLAIENDKILFYIRSDDDVSDIPFYMNEKKKYVCLNIHDYPPADYSARIPFKPVNINIPEATATFSYKISNMPDFSPESYTEKTVQFNWKQREYHFNIRMNNEVQLLFTNYPVVDFEAYFNIPLTRDTYQSLIPILRKTVSKMKQKNGVDYLMRFTRYAFLYKKDENNFGKEKRLSPELTLFSEYSDCDDRAALFFYLVKEIYDLPMIAVLYPTHITMAVQFNRPLGNGIIYNGKEYSICEPTPQAHNLRIGELSPHLRNTAYEVVYSYEPKKNNPAR